MKAAFKIFTFIFIIFLTEIYSQQSGWFWLNRYPQGNNLKASGFSNINTAFIVGDYGALLKTTNNGMNWINVFTLPYLNYYSCILFVNSITGFASGSYPNNNLYKTTDGANSWFTLNTGLNESYNDIFFYNDNTGVAVGSYGRLIKTTDGGNSWIISPPATTESYGKFIGFNNSNACYASTGAHILKSYSMGENWLTLPIPDSTRDVRDMFFLNENTGMYIGNFGYYGQTTKFVKTTDGGYSWFSFTIGSGIQMCSMYFINENTGYIANGDYNGRGTIRKTINGGANWNIQKDSINSWLFDIRFFNQNTGFSSGDHGTLLNTTNGGLNWNFYSSGFLDNINEVCFTNELTGYIFTSFNNHLLKTTNGCVSWDTVYITLQPMYSIMFVNNNTGYLGGGNTNNQGQIYKTTNAGLTWASQTYFQFNPVYDMHFLNELTGYAAGSIDKILKTTNGGLNWDVLSAGSSGTVYSIYFVNPTTGFFTCGATIYKTTSGGQTWDYLNLGNYNLRDIRFVNEQTGFVINSYYTSPYLFKTTNQGQTWNPEVLSFFSQLRQVFFVDINTGFLLSNNRIYKTTDCGITWGYQNAITDELSCMYFVNSSTGYIGGQYGKLLKTTNGGGNFVGITKQYTETIPEHFSLSQNYPNPFNPSTTIKFAIPPSPLERAGVRLTIYDILGREIATLVNEQLQPGEYSVTWDASNYPSGVYFYTIIVRQAGFSTGDYIESNKMVLIK